jgi:hypothetical protein
MRLLEGILARNPGWIEGQNTLATLRATAGEEDFARGFAAAAKQEPGNAALLTGWFHKLAAARQWEAARRVLALGEARMPEAMAMARLYLDCETGEAGADPQIFAPFAASSDPGLALLQIRHALRHHDAERALALAEAQLDTPAAAQFWPYCSLCWRLTGSDRAQWLEGDPPFAAQADLDLGPAMIGKLAAFLSALHTMAAPYPEQSVRGGTQTDRNLLLHHEPLIQQLRARIVAAVARWRDRLPAGNAPHPLLSRKPGAIRFSGSWSVRLAGGGHHSAHVHPQGWASSALYIAVPDVPAGDHAGDLALGLPPAELGLALEPTQYFRPRPGRLVLFPSTSWHGTVPCADGERLTIAFDVAPGGLQEEQ